MSPHKQSGSSIVRASLALINAAILPLMVSGLSNQAIAATTNWSAGPADWFTPGNWDNGVPLATDDAVIDNNGTAQVATPGAVADRITIGVTNGGNLEITGGGSVTNDSNGSIGSGATAVGSVNVSGAGSTWTNNRNVIIGSNGRGTLNISNGGVVTSMFSFVGNNSGSDGSVTVDGAGSSWTSSDILSIGALGTGCLEITNGGTVSNSDGRISGSVFAGGIGSVVVDGPGSTWINGGRIFVGDVGTGSLVISGGGAVINTEARIGADNVGTFNSATVTGEGSTWTSTLLIVGRRSNGSLIIAEGGTVNVSGPIAVVLGDLATSAGTLTIGAGGSAGVLNASGVTNFSGIATLNFNHTDVNYFFTTNGTASGSAVPITGATSVNHNGGGTTVLTGINTYDGNTTINGGALIVNGSNINSVTTVNTEGTLGGSGTVGIVNISGGTFAPGSSIGTTTVMGDVDFSGAAYTR